MSDTNIYEFISKKIDSAFTELTEKIAEELADELGENMPVGSLAFEMTVAQVHMQNE